MKLRTRLTVTLTAVTSLVLGVSFSVALALVERDEERDFDASIATQAGAMARLASESDIPPHQLEGLPGLPALIPKYVAFYGPDSHIVASTRNFTGVAPISLGVLGISYPIAVDGVRLDLMIDGRIARGVVLPLPQNRAVMFLLAHDSVDSDVLFLRQVFAALFLSALVFTSLVARWLGARLSFDVNAIARVAQGVSEGDLSIRVGNVATGSNETRALANDLDHMIVRLGELVTAQRTFVSHAAHELRSPLAALRGELQLAIRRPRDASAYKESIEHALSEVEDLVALAEDLLSLARAQGTAVASARSTVGEVVGDAVKAAEGLARARGVSVRAVADGFSDLPVRGARRDLARALRNLLDNAVSHSLDGGEVRTKFTVKEAAIEIGVEDDGPGVNAKDAENLFTPFWRGADERAGEAVGAGLGLAIAREIARASGGDLSLDAQRSLPGARFVLRLARADV